ncbi:MAG: cobalamin biosynthesis protein [Desulfobacteraceae bacterium]
MTEKLSPADLFVSDKLAGMACPVERVNFFSSLAGAVDASFFKYRGHVFIFAAGIAVRVIAGLLKSKSLDPAVVVMDEKGQHAISLLSGHIGGANQLALKVSQITGSVPVITTATDVNHLPAIDEIAGNAKLAIENPGRIKRINMGFLQNKRMRIYDPYSLIHPCLPEELFSLCPSDDPYLDVYCSDVIGFVPRETLVLRPVFLHVGVGCNRGTSADEIFGFVHSVFTKNKLSLRSVCRLASIDVKADETGLLECAKTLGLELKFYSGDELRSVNNIKTPSKMAEKYLGVKSVCEAAAILSSDRGSLAVPKKIKGNVTLAAARIRLVCL